MRADSWHWATDGPQLVTADMLEETYNRLLITAEQPGAEGAHTGAGDELDSSHFLKVVDAFEMPAWRWGDERKGFEKSVLPLETGS